MKRKGPCWVLHKAPAGSIHCLCALAQRMPHQSLAWLFGMSRLLEGSGIPGNCIQLSCFLEHGGHDLCLVAGAREVIRLCLKLILLHVWYWYSQQSSFVGCYDLRERQHARCDVGKKFRQARIAELELGRVSVSGGDAMTSLSWLKHPPWLRATQPFPLPQQRVHATANLYGLLW